MQDPDVSRRWQLLAPDGLVIRVWDGSSVVFDERTGATHLLGGGATALLQALHAVREPLSVDELLEALDDACEDLDEGRRQVAVAIATLTHAGLTVPAAP